MRASPRCCQRAIVERAEPSGPSRCGSFCSATLVTQSDSLTHTVADNTLEVSPGAKPGTLTDVSVVSNARSPTSSGTDSRNLNSDSDQDTDPCVGSDTANHCAATPPADETASKPPLPAPLLHFASDPLLPPPARAIKTVTWLRKQPQPEVADYRMRAEQPRVDLEACGWLHEGIDSDDAEKGDGQPRPDLGGHDSDGDSSTSDFVCQTAASIERAWAAVQQAKQRRPTCLRWWSY